MGTQSVMGGKFIAGDVSAGDVSAGDVSAGDVSAGDVSAGDVSAGDVSAGDVSAGDGEDCVLGVSIAPPKNWVATWLMAVLLQQVLSVQ